MCVHMCACAVCGKLFFPFTIWVSGIKFTLSDLVANTFIHLTGPIFFFLSFLYLIPSHSFPVWGARFSCSQYYLSNLHPIQAHSNAGSRLEKLEQKQLLPYRATVSSVTLDQLFNLSFSFFISTKGSYLLWVTAVRMIRIIFFNAYTRHSINYRLPI